MKSSKSSAKIPVATEIFFEASSLRILNGRKACLSLGKAQQSKPNQVYKSRDWRFLLGCLSDCIGVSHRTPINFRFKAPQQFLEVVRQAVPSQTVSRLVGNEANNDSSEQAAFWRTVRMRVTAYCPCRRCCGRYSDGKTASGHKIKRGDTFVAADKRYSFGTEMIVPGYNNSKPVKVPDRGRAIRGNRLDVFFDSHRKARKWDIKYLSVRVRIN